MLDGSPVLRSVVQRVAPPDVAVESAESFDEALARLCEDPPDALIVNISPIDLPWTELQAACRQADHPIPTLFESCIHRSAEEAGIETGDDYTAFLAKPYPLNALRARIEWLVRTVERDETGPVERKRDPR